MVFKIVFAAGCLYFAGLIGTEFVSNNLSPKINSQIELEQLVERERKKINPNNNCVVFPILSSENEARSYRMFNGWYVIDIGGKMAHESSLRHELYHILDGHCDDVLKSKSNFQRELRYLFIYESQAAIYESTGLKL